MRPSRIDRAWRLASDRFTSTMSGRGINPLLRRAFRLEVTPWKDALDDLRELLGSSVAVIVDAGAHVGDTAASLAQRFPGAKILAFEPYPDSFARLQRRAIAGLRPYPIALGAQEGEAILRVNGRAATNSLLPASETGRAMFPTQLDRKGEVLVKVTTLDEICDHQCIRTIDLLKLDVQGYELEVLRGARKALPGIAAVYCEVNFVDQYVDAARFGDVDLALRKAGFTLHDLYNLYRDCLTRRLIFADALYLNSRGRAISSSDAVPTVSLSTSSQNE